MDCPSSGYFANYAVNKCLECYPTCYLCRGLTENECTVCSGTKLLFNSNCLDNCPEIGFYPSLL